MELLLMGKKAKPAGLSVDVNVDQPLVDASATVTAGTYKMVTMAGAAIGVTATFVLGYWKGVLYLLKSDGLYKYNPADLAYLGKVAGVAGRTIPLNSTSFLYKGVIYFGQGNGKTGIVESLNLETMTYTTYPVLSQNYGALYVDDTYVYLMMGVYTTAANGFPKSLIYRIPVGGGTWEAVTLSGQFTHAVLGGDATLYGGKVYITGGGSIASTSDSQGAAYSDIHIVDLTALTIVRNTIGTLSFTTYDMPSCVWKGRVYSQQASSSNFRDYNLDTGVLSVSGSPYVGYMMPCMRVGDLFYYGTAFNETTFVRRKLFGGI